MVVAFMSHSKPQGAMRTPCNLVCALIAALIFFSTADSASAQRVRRAKEIKKEDVHAMGVTLGGEVRAIVVAPNGDVYAGGSFTDGAGSADIDFIARWNGTSWSPLGKGLGCPCDSSWDIDEGVHALAIDGSKLYVGGRFGYTGDGIELNNFARWDMNTNTWEPLMYPCSGGSGTCGPGLKTGFIRTIAQRVGSSGVYVGGDFLNPYLAPGGADYAALYTGSAWTALSSGPWMDVRALYVNPSSGTLYAGGNAFERWNGTSWSYVSGAPNYIYDIEGSGGDIYLAGNITLQVGTSGTGQPIYAYGVVKWDGATWSKLGSNPIGDDPYTDALAVGVAGSSVYIGGDFSDLRPGTVSHRFACWNGSSWGNAGAYLGNSYGHRVNAVTTSGSNVYIGGNFGNAGGVPEADYIARYDGTNWYALANPTPTPTITPTFTPTSIATSTPTPAPTPSKPVVQVFQASGARGTTIRLLFKVFYSGAGTSELITIEKRGRVLRQVRGRYAKLTSGQTYYLPLNSAGLARGVYQYCLVATDNYFRRSNRDCTSLQIR